MRPTSNPSPHFEIIGKENPGLTLRVWIEFSFNQVDLRLGKEEFNEIMRLSSFVRIGPATNPGIFPIVTSAFHEHFILPPT